MTSPTCRTAAASLSPRYSPTSARSARTVRMHACMRACVHVRMCMHMYARRPYMHAYMHAGAREREQASRCEHELRTDIAWLRSSSSSELDAHERAERSERASGSPRLPCAPIDKAAAHTSGVFLSTTSNTRAEAHARVAGEVYVSCSGEAHVRCIEEPETFRSAAT